MIQLSMCRICLVEDVKMNVIINSNLQELYEKLIGVPILKADGRPLQVCYICHARLRNCHRLQSSCLKSEEFFTQMLENNKLKQKPHSNMKILEIAYPVQLWSCVPEVPEHLQREAIIPKVEVITDAQVKQENFDDQIHQDNINTHEKQLNINTYQNSINTQVNQENSRTQGEQENSSAFIKQEDIVAHIKQENLEEHNMDGLSMQYTETIMKNIEHDQTQVGVNYLNHITSSRNIVTTKTAGSSINENIKANYILNNERMFSNIDAIIENNIKLDDIKPFIEPSDSVHLKTVKIVLNRIDLECVKISKPVTKKMNVHQVLNEKSECSSSKHNADVKKKNDTAADSIKILKKRKTRRSPNKYAIDNLKSKHMCDVCEKCFTQKQHLILHTRIHTGEKQYICDVCKKGFSHKGDVLKHIRVHTGEKPYKCDICKKSFSENCKLTLHYRKHTGEKPYMCDVCQKYFSDRTNLVRHTRVHTGVKPYKCNICKKRFNEKSALRDHGRVHTREKPFKCDMCEKCYRFRNDLKYHKRLHIDTKTL